MTDTQIKKALENIIIIIDTRENVNNHITKYFDSKGIKYLYQALKFGDYSAVLKINGEEIEFFDKVCVERKNSLEEISSNLSSQRDRFERELERGLNSKFIVMVEKKKNEKALKVLNKIKNINKILSDNNLRLTDDEIEVLEKSISGIGSYEDIVNHNYDTDLNEKSFLGTLFTYGHRYGIDINFIEKRYAGLFIYWQLYYFARNYLKSLEVE